MTVRDLLSRMYIDQKVIIYSRSEPKEIGIAKNLLQDSEYLDDIVIEIFSCAISISCIGIRIK